MGASCRRSLFTFSSIAGACSSGQLSLFGLLAVEGRGAEATAKPDAFACTCSLCFFLIDFFFFNLRVFIKE